MRTVGLASHNSALLLTSPPGATVDGLQRQSVAGDQRLHGNQQIKDVSVTRAQEEAFAIRQQSHLTRVIQRLRQAASKAVAQRVHHLFKDRGRKSSPA